MHGQIADFLAQLTTFSTVPAGNGTPPAMRAIGSAEGAGRAADAAAEATVFSGSLERSHPRGELAKANTRNIGPNWRMLGTVAERLAESEQVLMRGPRGLAQRGPLA